MDGNPKSIAVDYRLATTEEAIAYIGDKKIFAFDLETVEPFHEKSFIPKLARPLGYSVSIGEGSALYIPESPDNLRALLEDESVQVICHNAKFEAEVLLEFCNIRITNVQDTKLAAYVLGYRNTGLKAMSAQELGVIQMTIDEVKRGRPTEDITPEEWLPYGAADSDMTWRLHWLLQEELDTAES